MSACGHVLCGLLPGQPCGVTAPPIEEPLELVQKRKRGRPPKKRALMDMYELGKRDAQAGTPSRTNHSKSVADPHLEAMRLLKNVTPYVPKEPIATKPKVDRETLKEYRERLRTVERNRKAKASLAEFIRQGWEILEPGTPLLWNWHIEALANHLQWVFEDWIRTKKDPTFVQRVRNLLVNIPPGTAKSRIVSVFFVAWAWLHWPSWRVMCLSANPEVALRDASFCRQLIESKWYRESFGVEWELREDQNAKSNFENTAGGARGAKGITAKIIGLRADAIIVDDPHDAKEIYSDVQRKAVLTAWNDAIANRVNDLRTSIRIGVMQRLHEEDWSGFVLAQGIWCHVRLPMEYESKTECKCPTCEAGVNAFGWKDPRTVEGEVLHPLRFPPEVLADEKKKGSMYYSGQFQQRPAPAEGGMFKRLWWRFFRVEGSGTHPRPRPEGCVTRDVEPARVLPNMTASGAGSAFEWILVSLDAAFKDKPDGSRVSFLVIGGNKADRFVLDNHTEHMDYVQTKAKLRELQKKYPEVNRFLVEDKANGTAIINELNSEIGGIIEVKPEGGKESRAYAIQPLVEAGNVYLLDGAPWLDDFITELSLFPNGSKDDQVDSLSQALNYMRGSTDAARAERAFG